MAFKLKNFTVDTFNRDVNQSGDLLSKYKMWSGYREQISTFIGEAFTYNPKIDRVLVTAAGNLNDIDLHMLCSKLDEVTLSDADIDGMRQGIARQKLSETERQKIQLAEADYTGAKEAGFFSKLESFVQNKMPAVEIAEYMKDAIAALANAPVQAFPKRYPLIISCPVYTQLLYTQIEVFLKLLYEAGLYGYDDLNLILNAAYGAMPGILRRYNSMLLSACETDGFLVLLSDMVEMEIGGKAYREMLQASRDGCIPAKDAETLITKFGSELSVVGRDDFRAKTEALQENYFLWPFDETKAYLVYASAAQWIRQSNRAQNIYIPDVR